MPPVPVYVKGGAWTNLEDQIVKAAIQKYGTHQWSKVASLLQKKSAKQCQIRWDEYLNPRLNFTEFSKEEDAKLLELARKLPNQWRTISDAMGRTTQVCIERYNKLLEGYDLGVSSSLEFKVGDVNPHAETQVAKPDGAELEDEEREMLAEARARLLNTQGKKATRKVRERMLEESKRIAQLQKRRELKQAGVRTDIKRPRKKYATEIDYNEDVVYEQQPSSGVYDTSLEDERMAANIERFEKDVSLRGLRGSDEGNRGKRKREHTAAAASPKSPGVVPNEYKKPKLQLSRPGAKTNSEEMVTANKNALVGIFEPKIEGEMSTLFKVAPVQQTLAQLFAKLPPPKNDFEIVLNDEPEVDDQESLDETRIMEAQESKQAHVMSSLQPLHMECLDKKAPAFIQNPKNIIEQTFNELVASSSIQEPFVQPQDLQIFLDQVEVRIQNVHVKEVKRPQCELSDPSVVLDSINDQLTRIKDVQRELEYIKPVAQYNDKLCAQLCSKKLPRLRKMQQRYYVGYHRYQSELQAIETTKKRLHNDLESAMSTTT